MTETPAPAREPLPPVEPFRAEHLPGLTPLWARYVEELRALDESLVYDAGALDRLVRSTQGNAPSRAHLLVQQAASEPIGFLVARTRMATRGAATRLEGFVSDVFVSSAHRRRGVATCLHAAALAQLRGAGVRAMALMVLARNERAVRFWRALGYRDSLLEMTRPMDA